MPAFCGLAGNDFGQWCMGLVWVEKNRSLPRATCLECVNSFDRQDSFVIG